ncbi:MAG: helix-turn-helix domain-containing protein [Muribaculaceae bacterium]|nr:helix-turn-helix domain-containing protein [Muribaculaceae bacterium]
MVFIAENMCMSQSTLYRKIMAIVGISTNEYIRHRRLIKAVELLNDGSMTVTEIAFATGFGNHSSFGKAFKKTYGCTPTEFKTKDKK